MALTGGVMPIHGRYLVDTCEALLPLVITGFGFMLQPIELVADALASGQLVKLLLDCIPPGRPSHLLYPADRCITPKLRSFVDFALLEFAADSWQAS